MRATSIIELYSGIGKDVKVSKTIVKLAEKMVYEEIIANNN
jgi:hypothetical protein